MTNESAEQLWLRLQRNPSDQDAWRQFLAPVSQRMTRYLLRLGLDRETARDVRQEALVTFIINREKILSPQHAEGYLKRAAYHRYLDRVVQERNEARKRQEHLDLLQSSFGRGMDIAADGADPSDSDNIGARDFEVAIRRLKPHEQRLLQLKLAGTEPQEIDKELGTSPETRAVRESRLRRVFMALLRELDQPRKPAPRLVRTKKKM